MSCLDGVGVLVGYPSPASPKWVESGDANIESGLAFSGVGSLPSRDVERRILANQQENASGMDRTTSHETEMLTNI
jgi:hypothetical protein